MECDYLQYERIVRTEGYVSWRRVKIIMSGKIDVLGVKIDNVTAQEAMEAAKEFLKTDTLSSVGTINGSVLLEAGQDEEYRHKIENLDLCVVTDRAVLDAAGITDAERRLEIEDNWFLISFLEYVAESGYSVTLLCGKKSDKPTFAGYVSKHYPEMKLAGIFAAEDATQDDDSLVNLINGAGADVLVAAMRRPEQEEFLYANRQKLNAKLWLGIGDGIKGKNKSDGKSNFFEKLIEKTLFKRKVLKYQNEKGDK